MRNDGTWIRFRVFLASQLAPAQVSKLLVTPMTAEVAAVMDGLGRIVRPQPIRDLSFEFADHLSLSMAGASRRRENIHDYHAAVASVLLEFKVLQPNRSIFEVADPIGLLLLAALDYPRTLIGSSESLADALEDLVAMSPIQESRGDLVIGSRMAGLLERTIKQDCGTVPARAAFDGLAREAREALSSGRLERGITGAQFWSWLAQGDASRASAD